MVGNDSRPIATRCGIVIQKSKNVSNFRWGYGGFDSSGGGRKSDRTCSKSNRSTWPIFRPLRMPWSCQPHAVRSLTPHTCETSRNEIETRPVRSIGVGANTAWRFMHHRQFEFQPENATQEVAQKLGSRQSDYVQCDKSNIPKPRRNRKSKVRAYLDIQSIDEWSCDQINILAS